MKHTDISIEGLDPAEVLAALYNASYVRGAGVWQAREGEMTVEIAQKVIDNRGDDSNNMFPGKQTAPFLKYDYLFGRLLKVNLTGNSFRPGVFDDYNGGEGTAKRIIDALRAKLVISE